MDDGDMRNETLTDKAKETEIDDERVNGRSIKYSLSLSHYFLLI